MSGVEEIEVTIHPDGRVEVQVRGVQGPGCVAATKKLEQYLGGNVSRELTDEYSADALLDQDASETVGIKES
ncbi:MAG TPA: DUF2997 domain-containing protein [Kofleriaceae bacterium]|nr:DUF2997 domain-containing protein [Kofleriaceae bacterium]